MNKSSSIVYMVYAVLLLSFISDINLASHAKILFCYNNSIIYHPNEITGEP